MLPVLTFLMVVAGLAHLWLQFYNRVLLLIADSPRKEPFHHLTLFFMVVLPSTLIVLFREIEAVQLALNWEPRTAESRLIFCVFGILWIFALSRFGLWFGERTLPSRSTRLCSEMVEVPRMPQAPSLLPLLLRPFETTLDLEVTRREIEVPGLAAEFDGLTIAHVADVHYDPRFGRRMWFREFARLVNGLDADVVVFTGDFINRRRLIDASVRYHATMQGKLATIGVLGNHDYWTNAQRVRDACKRHGIRLMHNKRWTIERGGRRLTFAGTDAPWGKTRTPWRSLLKTDPGEALILLSHTPDNAPVAARHGANLILSGHNHGGQVCFPIIGPLVVPSRHGHRFVGGVYDVGRENVLVVSRGVGTSVRPGSGRTLCPPELVVLTLRAPFAETTVRTTVAPKEKAKAAIIATMPG